MAAEFQAIVKLKIVKNPSLVVHQCTFIYVKDLAGVVSVKIISSSAC